MLNTISIDLLCGEHRPGWATGAHLGCSEINRMPSRHGPYRLAGQRKYTAAREAETTSIPKTFNLGLDLVR